MPETGSYEIVARGLQGQYGGVYTFELAQTPQADLTLGIARNGDFVGSGQAQLFRFEMADSLSLIVQLDDPNSENQNELYLKFGAPTRRDFDYRSSRMTDADQRLTVTRGAGPLVHSGLQ